MPAVESQVAKTFGVRGTWKSHKKEIQTDLGGKS